MKLWVILIYAISVLAILLITFIYKLKGHFANKYFENKVLFYIAKEENLKANDVNSYIKKLEGELTKKKNAFAYEVAIGKTIQSNTVSKYIFDELNHLTPIIGKHSLLIRTYFAYLLERVDSHSLPTDDTIKFLKNLLSVSKLFAMENALGALIKLGSEDDILYAIEYLNKSSLTVPHQLLSTYLAGYRGNKKKVADLLLNNFSQYKVYIKVAIIDFIRIAELDENDELLAYLTYDQPEDIIYASLRYYEVNKYGRAENRILRIGRYAYNDELWGLVSRSAAALSLYKSDDTMAFLIQAVSAPDWYAREHAVEALMAQYGKKSKNIIEGTGDKYAIDMFNYKLSLEETKEGE